MAPEKSIQVTIMGRSYPLRVRPEDEALMYQLAATVDEKMRAFREAHPEQSELTAAVIVALSLAEALYEAREALRELDETFCEAVQELLALLEHPESVVALPEQPARDAI
ncbi:cell division protein ZapA [Rhodothermus profundi]|nr:cell division protein ZapA [Rhodothermus profundi]